MPDDPNLALIRRYYEGCSTADKALMLSTLLDDARHHFVEEPPVRGAAAIAEKWLEFFVDGWSAARTVEHGIEMATKPSPNGRCDTRGYPANLRGLPRSRVDVFRDGLISEIRAYELVGGDHPAELDGYPYAERGYPYAERGYPMAD